MAGFHLSLFGIPELRDVDGRVVLFRTHKQLALLVYLAFEGRVRPASRDALVDLLWSDATEPKARHSLSQALSAIRGKLGLSSVRCVRDSIMLAAPLTTDLELQQLSDVGGDLTSPLRDLDRSAGADFAQWVDNTRVQCRKYVRDSLTRALEKARASGNVRGVHEQAISLYAVDPGSDIAAHVLAERELLRGDAPQAIRFLRSHLVRAERDLGRSPAELKRLLRRIENGRPLAPPPIGESAPLLLKAPEEAFVGREAELADLERVWAEARRGTFVGCLVTGDTGIGKSALVRRFATSVTARGVPVLFASCQEIGSAIPFAVASDLIQELIREPGLNATDPAWLSEVSRVYPMVRTTFPGVPEPPTVPGESIRLRVAEALFHMIEAVADGGPVLMVLDDVPHVDPASLETLHALTRRLDRTPFLLVGTRRTAASTFGAETLGPATWGRTLDVTPLGKAEMARMITAVAVDGPTPDDSVRAEIVELAAGNPYFAEMLLNDWKKHSRTSLAATRAAGGIPPEGWQPPDTLRMAFARQSTKLASVPRELLNMLAVAGRALVLAEVVELLGWDPVKVDRAILTLLDEGVVRFDQGRVGFKNELHRAYMYYAIPVDLRRYCHGKIASALMRQTEGHKYRTSLHAAFHFLRASMVTEAVETVFLGVAEAISQGAPGEAEQALSGIREHASGGALHKLNLLLTQAVAAQGRYGDALSMLSSWRPETPLREEAAIAARMEAELLMKVGTDMDGERPARAIKRAVATARLSRNSRLIVEALQVEAEAAAETGNTHALSRVARTVARIGDGASAEVHALAQMTAGYCLMAAGDLQAAEHSFSSCARELEALRMDPDLRRALNGIGMCCTELGKFDRATRAFRRAIPLGQRTGNAHLQANIWTNLGVLFVRTGAWLDACSCFVEAEQHSTRSSIKRTSMILYPNAAMLAIDLGALSQANDLLERAEDAASAGASWVRRAELLYDRAAYHLAKGEQELAWQLVEQAEHVAQSREGPPGRLSVQEYLRRYCVFATHGYAALRDLATRRESAVARLGVTRRLEVEAFDAWAAGESGGELNTDAAEALTSAGLYGILAHLVALGTPPPNMPRPADGESSAALVARLFPDAGLGVPPAEIPFAQ